VGLSRRAWYREDPAERQQERDAPVIDALNALVEKHPRWGFWKYFHALRLAGHRWNHKRVLNILDEGTREALEITVATSIPAGRLVRILDALVAEHGTPWRIRVDNGSEMTSAAFVEWCEQHKIRIIYIQPGKPNQNAYIERFNRSFRHEVLDANLFRTLGEVREIASAWQISYNEERPHAALGNVLPAEFKRFLTAENSINQLCA